MKISFRVTKEEAEQIEKIVKRACGRYPDLDKLTCTMDLTACHANGMPLDFGKFLEFSDFDFAHDVYGVARHINRETGELMDCFVPRCAV